MNASQRELVMSIQQLNRYLIAKTQGNHLAFPNEQKLNESIEGLIQFIKTQHDVPSLAHSADTAMAFRINFWLLENMVSGWSHEKELNEQRRAELLRMMGQLECTEGWRLALSSNLNQGMEVD